MDEVVLFALLLVTADESNSSVRFLGESTARQSSFRFYLTFSVCDGMYDVQCNIVSLICAKLFVHNMQSTWP